MSLVVASVVVVVWVDDDRSCMSADPPLKAKMMWGRSSNPRPRPDAANELGDLETTKALAEAADVRPTTTYAIVDNARNMSMGLLLSMIIICTTRGAFEDDPQ